MSEAMKKVVSRLESDWQFIASYLENPEGALKGMGLNASELQTLVSNDPRSLNSLGLNQNAAIYAAGGGSQTCKPTSSH
jgi:hypothetical protein